MQKQVSENNTNSKIHTPVMLDEVIENLDIKKDGIYLDATMGDAGHSTKILKKLGSGKLISIDWDQNSVNFVKESNSLAKVDNWTIKRWDFAKVDELFKELEIEKLDGALFDLGLSSRQLKQGKRGFSFYKEGDLDMRMDDRLGVKAKDLLMALTHKEMTKLFKTYGEERYANDIASSIINMRDNGGIGNTKDLVKAILRAVPENYDSGRKHPARRVFQALRIAVNDEINNITKGLDNVLEVMGNSGRIVVLTYHSLEENVVNNWVSENFENINLLTPLPAEPTEEEIKDNVRSRSAKMFVIEVASS
jgi:16S rRNA (cytosine1402-N4)-methyltransferase